MTGLKEDGRRRVDATRMMSGVRRTRTQDVERRQGFTEPVHRSRRFSASAGEEGLSQEEATAEREKASAQSFFVLSAPPLAIVSRKDLRRKDEPFRRNE
ncbi:hypothetical protein QLX08_010235 [Tetragonisca angustula]|uniref:Uncharacterized protein n=1 Tax=Tetragonisca angustula TaxID=166442 RepID=A0AAW0ZCU5_9HYME